MKIAVLCIATNFKIRMKIGNKALLKQEEKTYMSKILKELELWVENSKEDLVPIIITCFDEIYEMAVQRHFLAFKNEFGFISEGHVIRFGINSYPQADAYFILSTSETRIFQAEIFETVCEYRRNNPNKIVIARINDKTTLPMVFSSKFIEPVHSIVDRENGKFILRSNSKDAVYLDITEEMIRNSDFHKGILPGEIGSLYYKRNTGGVMKDGRQEPLPEGEKSSILPSIPVRNVVIIRGGGRLATSIALALHRFGYCVLITETQVPATIYRSMSFAQAVFSSEIEIAGVTAYLVSPSQIQIQKAWSAGSIPVIIDPGAEVLQLFDQTTVIKSLFNENLIGRPSLDILTYLKNETSQTVTGSRQNKVHSNSEGTDPDSQAFFSQYPLFALIDATSSKNPRPTCRSMAPVTIGLRGDQQPKEDVLFKIETRMNSLYGKIIFRRELHVAHVDSEIAEIPDSGANPSETAENGSSALKATGGGTEPDENMETPERCDRNATEQETKAGGLVLVRSSCEGRYKAVRRIGDAIVPGTVVGQIIGNDESVTEVTSPCAGRLVGNAASNTTANKNSVLAAVDSSIESKEDCLQPLPMDKTVAFAVLSLLEGKI